MCYKPRIESDEIKILRSLNLRMKLTSKEKQYYHNLVKGYAGEVMFDTLTEKLHCPSFILNDLLLEDSNSKFQLDSVIISQDPLYLFEVKNFEGDFYFEDKCFYTISKKEIKNPLLQLQRSESLLRQLLVSLGYNIPIVAYVVFINPHFACYQVPLNAPIIFPNQLARFMQNINKRPSILNGMHKKLADQLVSLHQIDTRYENLPPYNYNNIKKGFTCKKCDSFSLSVQGNKLICKLCGYEELVSFAVLRMVEEIKLLFPGRKITSNEVQEWCCVIDCKKRITRILRNNFTSIGSGKWTFYE